MSALLESIRDTFTTERAKARETYARIVRKGDDAKPADAGPLREAMATLGFTPDILERDLAAVREAARLQSEIHPEVHTWPDALAARQADREREGDECRAKRRALLEQFRLLATRERELEAAAATDDHETTAAIDRVEDAREALATLRQRHALVLGADD